MAVAVPQAAWYEDPWHQAAQRWWDGSAWTGYVAAPGSLLECDSVRIAFDLMARTCRISDDQGALVGSLDMSGGVSVPGQGSFATPQASELMIATPGDRDPSFAQPQSMAQMGPLATPQPVPVRDVAGHSLFILRPAPMAQSRKDFSVRVHGPDDTEMGRYQTGARGAKGVEVLCGEQLVGTVARDGARGAHQQIAVRGTDGTPLVTLRMGDGAVKGTVNVTVTVVGQVSGPVRHLAVILPLAFIALAAAAIPAMPMLPMMPGSGASTPGVADMSGRIMGAVIGRMFDSLGGE